MRLDEMERQTYSKRTFRPVYVNEKNWTKEGIVDDANHNPQRMGIMEEEMGRGYSETGRVTEKIEGKQNDSRFQYVACRGLWMLGVNSLICQEARTTSVIWLEVRTNSLI